MAAATASGGPVHLPDIGQSPSLINGPRELPSEPRKLDASVRYEEAESLGVRSPEPEPAGALMTRYEVDQFRKTFQHTIFVRMLEDGYHRSFQELYNLVQGQIKRKEEGGPNSFIWFRPLLKDNREKMETLEYFLCRGEESEREGNLPRVYTERLLLANYFEQCNDNELMTYFYRSCLELSNRITDDDGLTHALANANMGEVYLDSGDLERALEYLDNYHSLSQGQPWTNDDGISLVDDACDRLLRLYNKMGDRCLENGSTKDSVGYYRKAHDLAKGSDLATRIAETALKLAIALHGIKSNSEAITLLEHYVEFCTENGDFEGRGDGVRHIADCLVEQNKSQEAVERLSNFASEAKAIGDRLQVAETCAALGRINNSAGEFQQAKEQFQECYSIKRHELGLNPNTLDSVMVQCGLSRAHHMFAHLSALTEADRGRDVARFVKWKNGHEIEEEQTASSDDSNQ